MASAPAPPFVPPPNEPARARRLRGWMMGSRIELWVGLPTFVAAAAVAGLTSLLVPIRVPAVSPDARLEELVREGPGSYFHHIFDPAGMLGPLGHIDLTLDNFERETSHGVLLAVLPRVPGEVAEFTMHAAEIWKPGVDGADNGIIVFIFPKNRSVRVEVGYGIEPAFPDAEVRRLVSSTLLPAARAGDLPAAVEALVPPLLDRLRAIPPAVSRRSSWFSDKLILAREIPRRARLIVAAWRGGSLEFRLIVSTAAALVTALFAVLIGRIALSAALVARRLMAGRDTTRLKSASLELVNGVLRMGQVALILFLMAVGTSFFFPGTGSFGGAGVELIW